MQAAAVKALGKMANSNIIADFERILSQNTLFGSDLLKSLKLDIVRSLDNYPLDVAAPLLDKIGGTGAEELTSIAADIKKRLELRAFHEP